MTAGPPVVDPNRLREAVERGVGTVCGDESEYFALRTVARAGYAADNPMMVPLVAGATDERWAVELTLSASGDKRAVAIRIDGQPTPDMGRWAEALWSAWLACDAAPSGPAAGGVAGALPGAAASSGAV